MVDNAAQIQTKQILRIPHVFGSKGFSVIQTKKLPLLKKFFGDYCMMYDCSHPMLAKNPSMWRFFWRGMLVSLQAFHKKYADFYFENLYLFIVSFYNMIFSKSNGCTVAIQCSAPITFRNSRGVTFCCFAL